MKELIIVMLTCQTPEIVNKTDIWNEDDDLNLRTAQRRCGEMYEELPCVKVFIKKKELTYNVICGEKK